MSKQKIILVLIKNTGEEPVLRHVKNELESFQKLVGGYIEVCHHPKLPSGVGMVINEEGKIQNLQQNIQYGPYDVLVGPVVFVYESGDDFTSINWNKETINEVKKWIRKHSIPGDL